MRILKFPDIGSHIHCLDTEILLMLVKMGGAALADAVRYLGMVAQSFHKGLMNLYFVDCFIAQIHLYTYILNAMF